MLSLQILCDGIEQVAKFTTLAERYPADIDVKKGRYTVNGKSLMCLIALDCVGKYMEFHLYGTDEDNKELMTMLSENNILFYEDPNQPSNNYSYAYE